MHVYCILTGGKNKNHFGKAAILQASEKVIFNDRSNRAMLDIISSQIFGVGHSQKLRTAMLILESIFPATLANHGDRSEQYLFIDCSQISPNHDGCKVRSHIFPDERGQFMQLIFE